MPNGWLRPLLPDVPQNANIGKKNKIIAATLSHNTIISLSFGGRILMNCVRITSILIAAANRRRLRLFVAAFVFAVGFYRSFRPKNRFIFLELVPPLIEPLHFFIIAINVSIIGLRDVCVKRRGQQKEENGAQRKQYRNVTAQWRRRRWWRWWGRKKNGKWKLVRESCSACSRFALGWLNRSVSVSVFVCDLTITNCNHFESVYGRVSVCTRLRSRLCWPSKVTPFRRKYGHCAQGGDKTLSESR